MCHQVSHQVTQPRVTYCWTFRLSVWWLALIWWPRKFLSLY